MSNPSWTELMKQAQKMQQQMLEAQRSLQSIAVTGEAGAGLVKITMKGDHSVTKVVIDPSLLQATEKEMLEDLIAAATNDAARKIEQETKKQMEQFTKGLNLPTNFPSDDQSSS